jgi:hypothetical protein
MRKYFLFSAAFLCSCGAVPYELESAPNAVLRGTAGISSCAAKEPYPGTFSTLILADPVDHHSIRGATQIELTLPERFHVQYGRYVGKEVEVNCELSESGLCGYTQLSCAVSDMRIVP